MTYLLMGYTGLAILSVLMMRGMVAFSDWHDRMRNYENVDNNSYYSLYLVSNTNR